MHEKPSVTINGTRVLSLFMQSCWLKKSFSIYWFCVFDFFKVSALRKHTSYMYVLWNEERGQQTEIMEIIY